MSAAQLTWTDWSFEPTVTLGLAAVVVLYALAWRRGWLRAGDDTSAWMTRSSLRPWFFAAGMLTAVVALYSPIDEGGDSYLFALHMTQHLLLMMVAPPLVLLGIAGGDLGWGGTPRWLRASGRFLVRPWPACVVFNVVMLVWHVPALYDTTLTVLPVHIVEHITFLTAGVIFWWPVVDPLRARAGRPVSALTKIALLAVAGLPPTILGFIFAMAPAALYDFYARAPRLWGVSAVLDQQIGGVLMMGLGNLIYFAAVAVIFVRLLVGEGGVEVAAEPGAVTALAPPRSLP